MEKILEITSVKLSVLESFPPKLKIDAFGTVPTGGWSNPKLIPHIHIQAPPDGIYGFDFIADPPAGAATQVISVIEVSDIWENSPEGVEGVRIHAAKNSQTALVAGARQPHRQPNRFTLTDSSKGTRIVFFPRALTPLGTSESSTEAQLEYHGLEGQFIFRGDDITQEQTVLGSVVSVVLKPNADAGGLDFALILPPVNLGGEARQDFDTLGIRIRSRGRLINPAGAELSYDVVHLKGVAEDIPVL
ncbi:hypothetical protein C8R31_102304 [Nitrosospira sp. Nsp2]|uniref:hypothetical protein n=1 Tax=Nitrosospira sp. Nsp2 TaxID=136548 RepID=UPI000D32330F|nr:hypothetical protein [Nitrosospira sp. Nsp2]PTR16290.1 hypothetical protein C8R31_102304 [Nitrosospira sp. Nsp2]